jgi:hypothetical protein
MCELLHTSPVVQKMHVVEKAGPHYRASLGLFFIGPIVGGAEAQAIFCRRRHGPRRPALAKITPGRPAGSPESEEDWGL